MMCRKIEIESKIHGPFAYQLCYRQDVLFLEVLVVREL